MNLLPKYFAVSDPSPVGGCREGAGAARYCLALDLKDDPNLIAEYERYHQQVWPEIIDSIRSAGIEVLDIYRTGNRLFMILEAGPDFSFDEKAAMDAANPKVQEWEMLMWQFQQALPWAKEGEKWVVMEKIFSLGPSPRAPGPLPTSPNRGRSW